MFKNAQRILKEVPRHKLYLATAPTYGTTSKDITHSLVFRRASQDDKKGILAMRQDIPTDYLPSHFDFMISAKNRICFIAEIDTKIVGFVAAAYLDCGRTCHAHSARIHNDYEGHGVLRFMRQELEDMTKQHCSMFEYVLYVADTKHKFPYMRRLYFKPNFFTAIDETLRESIMKEVNKQAHNIPVVTSNVIKS